VDGTSFAVKGADFIMFDIPARGLRFGRTELHEVSWLM